jgi:CRISPR/Cas system CMR-associated protein Cmr5 small subunit
MKQVMTFQDKLDDVAYASRNEGRNEESIKRLKNDIAMLKRLGTDNNKIRSEMHREYSDVLATKEIDKYLAILDK